MIGLFLIESVDAMWLNVMVSIGFDPVTLNLPRALALGKFNLDHQLIFAHVFHSVLLTRLLISELRRYILIQSFLYY